MSTQVNSDHLSVAQILFHTGQFLIDGVAENGLLNKLISDQHSVLKYGYLPVGEWAWFWVSEAVERHCPV